MLASRSKGALKGVKGNAGEEKILEEGKHPTLTGAT